MKITLLTFLFLLCFNFSEGQNFETLYTRGYKSTFCGSEGFVFMFNNSKLTKTDLFYGTVSTLPSRRDDTQFDNSGIFIENWSPRFFLDEYGVDDYYRVPKFWYTLAFDKKGGNLLYILEMEQVGKSFDQDGAKYYFTQLGYDQFCKSK